MENWREEVKQKFGGNNLIRITTAESNAWKEKDKTEAKINEPGQFFQVDIVLTPAQTERIDQSKAYSKILAENESDPIGDPTGGSIGGSIGDSVGGPVGGPIGGETGADFKPIGKEKKRRRRGSITNLGSPRWTRPIPFSFDSTIRSEQTKNVIRQAIQFWQRETCLDFVENGSGTDRLSFFAGSGCFSSVGRSGGQQGISIGTGCEFVRKKTTNVEQP